MRSANIEYMPRLDHLRALAAGLVVVFHLFHYFFQQWTPAPSLWWAGLMVEGHMGVGLFFVS